MKQINKAMVLKAIGDVDGIVSQELPLAPLRATYVRVQVKASAINHLDLWVRKGQAGVDLKFPHVLGADGAGIVWQKGSEVEDAWIEKGTKVILHPGILPPTAYRQTSMRFNDESCTQGYQILGEHCPGTHATFVDVPVENCFALPSNLTFEQAASIPLAFTTAWHMLMEKARLERGQRVLIHAGASGVSSALIQIAALLDCQIIATAGSEEKLEYCKKLGATDTFNYNSPHWAKEIEKRVGKMKVDVICDHVGEHTWAANLRLVKWGGKIVICGASSGYHVQTDLRQIFYRQIQVLGSTMGKKADFPLILREFEKGHLKAQLGAVLPLAQLAYGHQLLEQRSVLGKVVLTHA